MFRLFSSHGLAVAPRSHRLSKRNDTCYATRSFDLEWIHGAIGQQANSLVAKQGDDGWGVHNFNLKCSTCQYRRPGCIQGEAVILTMGLGQFAFKLEIIGMSTVGHGSFGQPTPKLTIPLQGFRNRQFCVRLSMLIYAAFFGLPFS